MSMRRTQLGSLAATASLWAMLLICAPLALGQGGAAAKRNSVPSQGSTPAAAAAPAMPQQNGAQLDRVVAIVNDDLVLDSDVSEEQHFEELQPIGLSGTPRAFDRNRAIERLIDRALILQQARMEPGLEVSDEELDKEVTGLRRDLPGCKGGACTSNAGWDRYLAAHSFTPDAFRDRWRQRMEVLGFIEERFRAGARISEADIKKYYDTVMLPEYERQHVAAPKLEVLSSRIQQVLLQQQVTALLSDWLRQLRAQGSVAVLHPGEPAP